MNNIKSFLDKFKERIHNRKCNILIEMLVDKDLKVDENYLGLVIYSKNRKEFDSIVEDMGEYLHKKKLIKLPFFSE